MAISRSQMARQLYQAGGISTLIQDRVQMLAEKLNISAEEAMRILMNLETPTSENMEIMSPEDTEVMEMLMLKQQRPEYQYDEENMYEGPRDMRAGGGIAGLRQGYFVGGVVKSIGKAVSGAVKGATKAVKSIASSDIGKAALLAAGAYYAPMAFGQQAGFANFGNLVKSGLGRIGTGITGLFTGAAPAPYGIGPSSSFLGGLTKGIGGIAKKIGGSSLLSAGLGFLGGAATTMLTPEQIQTGMGQDPAATRAYLRQYYLNLNPELRDNPEAVEAFVEEQTREYAAKGGIMGIPTGEPRENQQGVKELDYRQEGGFVPVGIKEKADDVPAMLSKNEFVFTADAVRGAGDGDVDKGAQKLYSVMKTLENGGTV